MQTQKLIPVADEAAMREEGIPWTTHAARWIYRHRADNGLSGAFVNIGKRVYVDPAAFHALVRKRQAA